MVAKNDKLLHNGIKSYQAKIFKGARSMSYEENKTYWEEIQEKYEIKKIRYTPLYSMDAGMYITLEMISPQTRPGCPECGGQPIIHGYKKKR